MASSVILINPRKPQKEKINLAAKILKEGGIVSFPTETVYALGVKASSLESVKKIYKLKKRLTANPLAIFIPDLASLSKIVDRISASARILMHNFWPGPLTLIFPCSSPKFLHLTYNNKIGIRYSSAPVVRSLVKQSGSFITATSANLSGQKEAVTAEMVIHYFGDKINLILDGGELKRKQTTTVLDVSGEEVVWLRAGAIPKEEILEFVKLKRT